MTKASNPMPWEGMLVEATYEFAARCALLRDNNPYGEKDQKLSTLDQLIGSLATELWDQNFSQTEIRVAFERALKGVFTYAAGQERRG